MTPCGQEHMSCLADDTPIQISKYVPSNAILRGTPRCIKNNTTLPPQKNWSLFTSSHRHDVGWSQGLSLHSLLTTLSLSQRVPSPLSLFLRGCFHYFQSHRGWCPYIQDFWTCTDIVCSVRSKRAYLSQEWIVVISINTVMIREAFIAAGL